MLEPRYRKHMYNDKDFIFLGGTEKFDIAVTGSEPYVWLIWGDGPYQWSSFPLDAFRNLRKGTAVGERSVGHRTYIVRLTQRQREHLHAYVKIFAPWLWNWGLEDDAT